MTADVCVEWLPVVGYEREYEVSSTGLIRRSGAAAKTGRGQGGGARIGRVLKAQRNRFGYFSVALWSGGRQKMRLVHTVVAEAFIGPRPDGQEVNHKDGDKANNAAPNLEYLTRAENNRHAYRTGLRTVTEAQKQSLRSRDKPRQPRSIITCGCGCGAEFETPDSHGRPRGFVRGHRARVGRVA